MSWCWVRYFMLKHWKRTSSVKPCRGGPPWPPLNRFRAMSGTAKRGGHGGPPLHGLLVFLFLALILPCESAAQSLQATAKEIRAAIDARDFQRAETLARDLRAADPAAFTRNNYDYLLARLLERRGAINEASAIYLGLLERSSILNQYALWHLALLAKTSSDLALERQYITRLLVSYPSSALASRARERLIDSHRESGDHRAAIALLKPIASATGVKGRSAMAKLGEAYSKIGDSNSARTVFNQLIAGS